MTAGLQKIGQCMSGTLYRPEAAPHRKYGMFRFPELVKRIALLTPRAFKTLNSNLPLLQRLDSSLQRGVIDFEALYQTGLTAVFYSDNGRIIMGLRLPADKARYEAAEAELIPRQFGLELRNLQIKDLTEQECLNLCQLIEQLGGPKKIRSFTVVEQRSLESLTTNPDGTINITFERAELQT